MAGMRNAGAGARAGREGKAGDVGDRAQRNVIELRHDLPQEPGAIVAAAVGILALPFAATSPLLDDRVASFAVRLCVGVFFTSPRTVASGAAYRSDLGIGIPFTRG